MPTSNPSNPASAKTSAVRLPGSEPSGSPPALPTSHRPYHPAVTAIVWCVAGLLSLFVLRANYVLSVGNRGELDADSSGAMAAIVTLLLIPLAVCAKVKRFRNARCFGYGLLISSSLLFLSLLGRLSGGGH